MINIKNIFQGLFNEYRHQSSIPDDDFNKILAQVEKKIENEPPPRIAFIGDTGVGKSSTLNALFNAGRKVSHTKAETQEEAAIEIKMNNIQGERGVLVVYDMPGLSESLSKRDKHLNTYERVLKEVDVALWILDAQFRAIEHVQAHLENKIKLINPDLVERMVFALNKVDLVHPGQTAWHPMANLPSEEQEKNIEERIKDVEEKIRDVIPNWTGKIIGYSSEKRYNLPQLFDVILDGVPKKRQWVLASRKALADFLELVDPSLIPPDRRPQQFTPHTTTQEQEFMDMVEKMPQEEFAKMVANKESLLEWLKHRKTN